MVGAPDPSLMGSRGIMSHLPSTASREAFSQLPQVAQRAAQAAFTPPPPLVFDEILGRFGNPGIPLHREGAQPIADRLFSTTAELDRAKKAQQMAQQLATRFPSEYAPHGWASFEDNVRLGRRVPNAAWLETQASQTPWKTPWSEDTIRFKRELSKAGRRATLGRVAGRGLGYLATGAGVANYPLLGYAAGQFLGQAHEEPSYRVGTPEFMDRYWPIEWGANPPAPSPERTDIPSQYDIDRVMGVNPGMGREEAYALWQSRNVLPIPYR